MIYELKVIYPTQKHNQLQNLDPLPLLGPSLVVDRDLQDSMMQRMVDCRGGDRGAHGLGEAVFHLSTRDFGDCVAVFNINSNILYFGTVKAVLGSHLVAGMFNSSHSRVRYSSHQGRKWCWVSQMAHTTSRVSVASEKEWVCLRGCHSVSISCPLVLECCECGGGYAWVITDGILHINTYLLKLNFFCIESVGDTEGLSSW